MLSLGVKSKSSKFFYKVLDLDLTPSDKILKLCCHP